MPAKSLWETAAEQLHGAKTLEAIQTIVRSAARLTVDADGATFVLRDGDRCYFADEDAMSPLWKGQRFPITDCISGWAILNGAVAVVPDISVDPRIPRDVYRPTFVRSLVMTPIVIDEPIGAIGVYWAYMHASNAQELRRLGELAALTATAIARVGLDAAQFTHS